MKTSIARDGVLLHFACIALLTCIMTMVAAHFGWTATIDVPADYATIQLAVDAAAPGDTIAVAAGVYTEAVTVVPGSDLVIQGAGRDTTTWISPADAAARMHCIECSPADGTTLEISGFTFSVQDNAFGDGIAIQVNRAQSGALDLAVHDNTFVEFPLFPGETANSMLLCHNNFAARGPGGAAPVRIYNNIDYTTGGIGMSNSRSFDIYDNVFDGCSDAIYSAYGCEGSETIGDHHIYRNIFRNADGDIVPGGPWPAVLFVDNGLDDSNMLLPNTIEYNTFESNDYALGYFNMSRTAGYPADVVANNNFSCNSQFALSVDGTNPPEVNAIDNWWGAADGPSGEGAGSGDAVSMNVAFNPFWMAPYPVSISLTPSSATIYPQATRQYATTGTLLDGTTADVILECMFTSSNPAIATVGPATGLATGVAPGSSTITSTCFGGAFTPGRTLHVAMPDQPIANAGADRSIAPGVSTVLDGSASSDPHGYALTYLWSESVSSPATGLIASPTAVANSVTLPIAGIYAFSLVVNNGFVSSPTASVTVTAADAEAPIANAGSDATSFVGAPILLDGRGSTDPGGHSLAYLWSESIENPAAGLIADPTASSVTVTPPVAGNYAFSLVVNNGVSDSVPDSSIHYVATAAASMLVNKSEGGTISITDASSQLYGLSLEIPSGALSEDTEITVGEIEHPPALDPALGVSSSRAITFGPDGLQFSTPATVYIPASREDLEEAGGDVHRLFVFVYEGETRQWTAVPVLAIDAHRMLLKIEISHFSIYQAGNDGAEPSSGCSFTEGETGGLGGSIVVLLLAISCLFMSRCRLE